jgi:hypothetical protein
VQQRNSIAAAPLTANIGEASGLAGAGDNAAAARWTAVRNDWIRRAEVGHVRATYRRSRVMAVNFDHATAKGGT